MDIKTHGTEINIIRMDRRKHMRVVGSAMHLNEQLVMAS
jgi:hypothetical protein